MVTIVYSDYKKLTTSIISVIADVTSYSEKDTYVNIFEKKI